MPVAPAVPSARCLDAVQHLPLHCESDRLAELQPGTLARRRPHARPAVAYDQPRSISVARLEDEGPAPVPVGVQEHECLPRLERLRREERVLPERDAVADVQLLELGHDPIGAVNVETEDVLQPVVAVQAAAPLPHLDEPRPDGGWWSLDCDGSRGGERRAGYELVSGQPPARLLLACPPPTQARGKHDE